jgi:hypothetical protein
MVHSHLKFVYCKTCCLVGRATAPRQFQKLGSTADLLLAELQEPVPLFAEAAFNFSKVLSVSLSLATVLFTRNMRAAATLQPRFTGTTALIDGVSPTRDSADAMLGPTHCRFS